MQFGKTHNLAYGNMIVAFALLLGIALLSGMSAIAEDGDVPLTEQEPPSIQTIPGDGMNLEIAEHVSAYYVVVKVNPPVHNWFAGTFANLPTDKEVTIGLSMEGMDTFGNKGNVSKWQGLKPVMTYADPTRYETYEWFTKDKQGRWVSGDPFKVGEAKYAGTGLVPDQTIMPKEVASAFLSTDGKHWSAWREIDSAEAVTTLNIFRCKQRFALPQATLAMRVPFTYTYQQQFVERLKEAKLPGMFVDEIGETQGKRKLQIIRIEGNDNIVNAEGMKTVLVIAREHATEHASSWVVYGLLCSLITDSFDNKKLLSNTSWLLVPIEDVDGSVNATFDEITDTFRSDVKGDARASVYSYGRYFTDYVGSGRTIDVALTLHNIEATEGKNILCPFVDSRYIQSLIDFNRMFFRALNNADYLTDPPDKPWAAGFMTFRLYGWCSLRFHSLDMAFEVNDRYPQHPLIFEQLHCIGPILSSSLVEWLSSDEGIRWHKRAKKMVSLYNLERASYFERVGYHPDQRTIIDIIDRGF